MSKQKVLGIIQIPKIKLKEPIVEGVEKSNLKAGIGTYRNASAGRTRQLCHGRPQELCVEEVFRRLDELKEGDEVTILTQSETLRYSVTGSSWWNPMMYRSWRAAWTRALFQITCTPMYVHSHRLIVAAELVERVPRES